MAHNPSHLVERVAERLRGVGGLATVPDQAAADRAAERDTRPERDTRSESWPESPRSLPGSSPDPVRGPGLIRGSGIKRRLRREAAPLDADLDTPAEDAPADLGAAAGHHAQAGHHTQAGRHTEEAGFDRDPAEDFEPPLQTTADRDLRKDPDPATALTVPETPEQGRMPPLDMAALEKSGLVVGHKVRTRISEEFRITVGHLLRSMQANYSPGRGAPNVIMITSARPGEGKSFSTLNLAGSIAQHTQREVLLIDIDAKQRSISSQLGLADRPGLLDLSNNPTLRIEDVIIKTSIPHLSLMTVGSGQSGGLDITQTRPITTLVERIARRFPNSVVLLDAPPCLSTSDPSTLAPFVGQIVVVVEAERTQRNEVVAALDLIKACPSVTLMLNKIRLTTSYTFGAYHYFGTYS
jgi:receptor protein-tyrosine kinase